jgi:Alpha-2-macroglobulin RAP, N-terminal domain
LKEAEMRKKLIGIMSTYGLLEHFEDVSDPKKLKTFEHPAFNEATDDHLNKMVFRDKKLNKLWIKAERSGFTCKIQTTCLLNENNQMDLYSCRAENFARGIFSPPGQN